MGDELKEIHKKTSDYLKYSSLAFQMIAIILLFCFGGYQLDKWIPIQFPIFTIVLSLSGVFLSIYVGVRDFLKKKK